MASGWDVPQTSEAPPRFVLLGELASGGMGSIDLARMTDASGERIVAMKRVHPQFSRDAEFVQMFRDEIWLTQGLHHPNVVELVGWGEDEDGPYLVMELVDGAPLAEIAYRAKRKGRRLPDELVAYIAARVAEGLHAAHTLCGPDGRALGIVHRDITPSNVLIGFDGSIKITDFGIAKAAASGSHTRTGVVKGKVEYMSPEHALRRPVDGRSDLYSLGVVLFEVLRGDPPICGGSDLDLLKRVAYEPVPPLASLVPDVNLELAELIDRLVAKRPEDRPPDGASVARELEAWLAARRLRPRALKAKLAEHAERFGAARRRKLQKLMSAEGFELGSSSSWRDPKRVRAAGPPAPGTFRRLDVRGTRPVAAPEVQSGTREVIAAASPPLATPPLPAGADPVLDETERGPTRRVSTVPPPPLVAPAALPQPVVAAPLVPERPRWVPALLGVAIACVLVSFVVLVSVRSASSEPPADEVVEAVHAEPAAPPIPALEVAASEPEPVPEPPPPAQTAEEPAASAAPAPSAPKPRARAGQQRPRTGKVQTRRSSPCTPDRFDYPACR